MYTVQTERYSQPALSPGRNVVATPAKGKVVLLKSASGEVVGVLPTESGSLMGSELAIRGDGLRLALVQALRFRVWDLQSRNWRDFELEGEGRVSSQPIWATDKLLLLNDMLVDVDRRIPVWKYGVRGHEVSAVSDGLAWVVEAGTSKKNGGLLAATALPDKAVLDAAASIKPEDLLVLHPGMDVAIDLQLSNAPEEIDSTRKALEKRLQKNGLKVVPQSKVKLVASLQPGKTHTVRYHSFGSGAGNKELERQVTSQVLTVSFQLDGQTIWKRGIDDHAAAFTAVEARRNDRSSVAARNSTPERGLCRIEESGCHGIAGVFGATAQRKNKRRKAG